MSNTDTTKYQGIQVLAKSKQALPLIRHPMLLMYGTKSLKIPQG